MASISVDDGDGARTRAFFEALFERHAAGVLAYALRTGEGRPDAEDAVAETFLVAWRRLDAIPAGTLEAPWLYGVCRRVLSNRRRGADRRSRLLERLRLRGPALTSPHPDLGGPAIDALRLLRPDDQELLRLVAWEDLTHAQIAAILGISPNAVAIRLHRARRRFVEALSRTTGESVKGFGAGRTLEE